MDETEEASSQTLDEVVDDTIGEQVVAAVVDGVPSLAGDTFSCKRLREPVTSAEDFCGAPLGPPVLARLCRVFDELLCAAMAPKLERSCPARRAGAAAARRASAASNRLSTCWSRACPS